MRTVLLWIEASRPKTLVLSLLPVLIGSSFAAHHGSFSWIIALASLLTALFLQMGANFANDYYDCLKGADTSTRTGPRRLTSTGLISLSNMKLATFLSFSAVALLSIFLVARGGPLFSLLTTLSIVSGILYTGGPKPLGYLGLGELFVFAFFGPIGTAAAAYLHTLSFSWEACWLGCTPGLISTAVLVVNNLRDLEEDRRVGKKTLAVRWGKRFTKWEYTLCLLSGIFLPLFFGWWISAFALIPALIPLKSIWRSHQNIELNITLSQTAHIGLLTAGLLAFGLLMTSPFMGSLAV